MSVIWHDLECGALRRGPAAVALAGGRARRPRARRRRRHGPRGARPGAGRIPRNRARPRSGAARRARRRLGRTPDDAAFADRPSRPWSRTPATSTCGRAVPADHRPDADDPAARRRRRPGCVPVPARSRHLRAGGVLAVAIAEVLDLYEVLDGVPAPLPDLREDDGVVYSSQPIAVRADRGGFVLERRRETVVPGGRPHGRTGPDPPRPANGRGSRARGVPPPG